MSTDEAERKNTLRELLGTANSLEGMICISGGELSPEAEKEILNIENALATKIDAYDFVIKTLENRAEYWKKEAKLHAAIGSAIEKMVEKIRAAIKQSMEANGMDEIRGDKIVARLSDGPGKLVIYNEAEIPPGYTVLTRSFDNAQIKKDLGQNIPIPGARIENSKRLTIMKSRRSDE